MDSLVGSGRWQPQVAPTVQPKVRVSVSLCEAWGPVDSQAAVSSAPLVFRPIDHPRQQLDLLPDVCFPEKNPEAGAC